MKKSIFLAVISAMLVAMLAIPASANPAPPDVGTISGTADVGKTRTTTCTNKGGGAPGGAGLGFPSVATNGKVGYWRLLATNGVDSQTLGLGNLDVCGALGPVAGVGAACGISNGHSGKGWIDFASADVYLSGVNWVTSAGGFLPVTGEAGVDASQSTVKKGTTPFAALVVATGGLDCASKSGDAVNKTGGATRFTVVGTYTIA